jgi:hypothetical protein
MVLAASCQACPFSAWTREIVTFEAPPTRFVVLTNPRVNPTSAAAAAFRLAKPACPLEALALMAPVLQGDHTARILADCVGKPMDRPPTLMAPPSCGSLRSWEV